MSESITTFLESVYGHQWEGKIAVAAKTASGMATEFAESVEEIQAFAEKHGNRDIYITPATFAPHRDGSYSRKGESARAIYAIGVDVDFLHPEAHAETQLPSEKEAKRWIWFFKIRPSAVIRTGHGYQIWYFLKAPMDLRENEVRKKAERLIKAIQNDFRKAGEANGWKLDNTASLAQLFRLPGTQNCKCEPVVPVELRHLKPEVRYDWQDLYHDFVEFKPESKQEAEPGRAAAPVRQERFEADFDEIYRGCAFIRHWKDDAAHLPEPHWYSGMTVVVRCRDCNKIVHEVSRADPRYSATETDEKLRHALEDTGPMTCAGIAEKCGSEFCEGCPNRWRVNSPISLGLKQKARTEENRLWTIGELMALEDLEIEAIADGLICKGFSILAGSPKTGKSFMAQGLAVGVATGTVALGNFKTDKKNVLYLALEDRPQRLKKRLRPYAHLLGNGQADGLFFCTRWPTIRKGGLQKLREIIKQKGLGLVVIDTLQKFRGDIKIGSNLYGADYDDLGQIKELADDMGIAILVLHHTRKAWDDDILSTVSGSNGVSGTADTIMVLKRPRKQEIGTLFVTSRDFEEQEYAFRFKDGIWTYEGSDAKELQVSEERKQILDLLAEKGPMNVSGVAACLGRERDNTNWLLSQMVKDGDLTREKRGFYGLPKAVEPEPACGLEAVEEQNGPGLDLDAMSRFYGLL